MAYLRETAEASDVTFGANAIDNLHLDFPTFDKLVETNLVLFDSVFNKRLVIPDFQVLTQSTLQLARIRSLDPSSPKLVTSNPFEILVF